MVRNNLVNHSCSFPLNWHTSALKHGVSSQVPVIYPRGIKDCKKKYILKDRLLSLTGLLPYEHQSFAQGSVWDYKCYRYLSKCVFSSHLELQSVWNNDAVDPSVLLPLKQCWAGTSLLGKVLITQQCFDEVCCSATRTRVMARTSYFQNMFLWQKTEEGFHNVKMAMSYWWPLLKDGMLQWVIIFSCTSSYFTDIFFSSPVNMKNKLLNTKKPHPKHQSMSYVNMKNKWLNTKRNPVKTPKYVIWENKLHWSCSLKSCIAARWDEKKPEKQLWSQMPFNKSSFHLFEYLPKTSVTWVWLRMG